jgi:hypothetical protein
MMTGNFNGWLVIVELNNRLFLCLLLVNQFVYLRLILLDDLDDWGLIVGEKVFFILVMRGGDLVLVIEVS